MSKIFKTANSKHLLSFLDEVDSERFSDERVKKLSIDIAENEFNGDTFIGGVNTVPLSKPTVFSLVPSDRTNSLIRSDSSHFRPVQGLHQLNVLCSSGSMLYSMTGTMNAGLLESDVLNTFVSRNLGSESQNWHTVLPMYLYKFSLYLSKIVNHNLFSWKAGFILHFHRSNSVKVPLLIKDYRFKDAVFSHLSSAIGVPIIIKEHSDVGSSGSSHSVQFSFKNFNYLNLLKVGSFSKLMEIESKKDLCDLFTDLSELDISYHDIKVYKNMILAVLLLGLYIGPAFVGEPDHNDFNESRLLSNGVMNTNITTVYPESGSTLSSSLRNIKQLYNLDVKLRANHRHASRKVTSLSHWGYVGSWRETIKNDSFRNSIRLGLYQGRFSITLSSGVDGSRVSYDYGMGAVGASYALDASDMQAFVHSASFLSVLNDISCLFLTLKNVDDTSNIKINDNDFISYALYYSKGSQNEDLIGISSENYSLSVLSDVLQKTWIPPTLHDSVRRSEISIGNSQGTRVIPSVFSWSSDITDYDLWKIDDFSELYFQGYDINEYDLNTELVLQNSALMSYHMQDYLDFEQHTKNSVSIYVSSFFSNISSILLNDYYRSDSYGVNSKILKKLNCVTLFDRDKGFNNVNSQVQLPNRADDIMNINGYVYDVLADGDYESVKEDILSEDTEVIQAVINEVDKFEGMTNEQISKELEHRANSYAASASSRVNRVISEISKVTNDLKSISLESVDPEKLNVVFSSIEEFSGKLDDKIDDLVNNLDQFRPHERVKALTVINSLPRLHIKGDVDADLYEWSISVRNAISSNGLRIPNAITNLMRILKNGISISYDKVSALIGKVIKGAVTLAAKSAVAALAIVDDVMRLQDITKLNVSFGDPQYIDLNGLNGVEDIVGFVFTLPSGYDVNFPKLMDALGAKFQNVSFFSVDTNIQGEKDQSYLMAMDRDSADRYIVYYKEVVNNSDLDALSKVFSLLMGYVAVVNPDYTAAEIAVQTSLVLAQAATAFAAAFASAQGVLTRVIAATIAASIVFSANAAFGIMRTSSYTPDAHFHEIIAPTSWGNNWERAVPALEWGNVNKADGNYWDLNVASLRNDINYDKIKMFVSISNSKKLFFPSGLITTSLKVLKPAIGIATALGASVALGVAVGKISDVVRKKVRNRKITKAYNKIGKKGRTVKLPDGKKIVLTKQEMARKAKARILSPNDEIQGMLAQGLALQAAGGSGIEEIFNKDVSNEDLNALKKDVLNTVSDGTDKLNKSNLELWSLLKNKIDKIKSYDDEQLQKKVSKISRGLGVF